MSVKINIYFTYHLFRCGDSIFGAVAADAWSRLMQNADGPESFKLGFNRLTRKYAGDAPRLAYLLELFNDDKKAHFKRNLDFTNAVLVDVCECLFSALKTWVSGSKRSRTSLLMALIRIVDGCRNMILKPFLRPVRTVVRKYIRYCDSGNVRKLLRYVYYILICHFITIFCYFFQVLRYECHGLRY